MAAGLVSGCKVTQPEGKRKEIRWPGYIQLVEFETDDIDRVENAIRKFRDDHPDVMKFTFSRVGEDRDRPGTYISIVEFPSYDEAMEQSNHPALSEFVQSSGAGMMTNRRFRNLDVRSEI